MNHYISPQFLHQGKNKHQKNICPKVQCNWSERLELHSLHNLCKNKLVGRSAGLKSCYIPWLMNFQQFSNETKDMLYLKLIWYNRFVLWLEFHSVTFHFKNSETLHKHIISIFSRNILCWLHLRGDQNWNEPLNERLHEQLNDMCSLG